jgi:hypothetical protein
MLSLNSVNPIIPQKGKTMNSESVIQDNKDKIVREIKQLRQESGIGDKRISLYITDTPLVRGILHEHEEAIRKAANIVDIVQVDVNAGVPSPEEHPHRTFTLGEDKVTIAMETA